MPIEAYFERFPDTIDSFTERQDPKLGRVVIAHVLRESEKKGKSRRFEGTINFLPEFNWLVLSYDVKLRESSKEGNAPVERTESFTSEYDSEPGLLPFTATRVSINSLGTENKDTFAFRPLTNSEVAECKERCYLSGFGLPEPPGISWGLPRWLYFVSALGLITCIVGFFAVKSRTKG